MDATAWVAVAGIAATLVGSMVGPLIHEQVRRRSVREEQLRTARMDVYSDLIAAAAKVRDNAMTWSSLPLAELEESDPDHLKTLVGRIRAVGSDEIYGLTEDLIRTANEFNRRLFQARQDHRRAELEGTSETDRTVRSRLHSGKMADEVQRIYSRIIRAVRVELA